jgi:acetyl-CoA C-acetyltransferase
MHPADLLGSVLQACVDRAGIDPSDIGQIVGGCVEPVGEQAANVTRTAWLDAGLPETVAAISIDSACGSAQQAVSLAASLVASGAVDVALGCGLSSMSRLPIAASFNIGFDVPPTRRTTGSSLGSEFASQSAEYGPGQFGCAERLADLYGVDRAMADQFGFQSQQRAQRAWAEGRFDREVVAIEAPVVGGDASIAQFATIARDGGLRETSLEKLAQLKPLSRPNGVHTAGTASQISDGAAAVLLATRSRATELGMRPRARIVDHCHVGVDPLLMLSGPLAATQRLLERNALTIEDIDVYEINEAFAAVPLMWARVFDADPERLNPNGGAIALGHPVGATGARLIVSALHELERRDASLALVSMCAGGGLGTATLIERTA